MAALCYYISGHGFGHARRSVEVARRLSALRPELAIHLRSAAEARAFAGLQDPIRHEHVEIDRGVIETSPLSLNWPQTIENVRELVAASPELIAAEAAFLRRAGVQLVLADVPWLAGYIAAEAGVPCYAVGNFLWDWIYAPHLAEVADGHRLLAFVAGGYQRMSGWLRLPFPHQSPHFREAIDVPLVAVPPTAGRHPTLARLGVAEDDTRPRVLVAMRGSDSTAVVRAAEEDAGLLYLAAGQGQAPQNVLLLPPQVPFSDLVAASDVVLSKLGHGIVTDCVAAGARLLWPPRNGFAEDALLAAGLSRYAPNRQLPLADYEAGHWAAHVRALLAMPHDHAPAAIDGAQFLARWISQFMERAHLLTPEFGMWRRGSYNASRS